MSYRFGRITFTVLAILFVISLSGCGRVGDARSSFCDTLREVGALAVDLKNARADQPASQISERLESLREKKATLDRLARLTPIPAIDRLNEAIDEVFLAAGQVAGNTLGPAAERISAAGAKLEAVYFEVNDSVCAAK